MERPVQRQRQLMTRLHKFCILKQGGVLFVEHEDLLVLGMGRVWVYGTVVSLMPTS